MIYCRRKLEFIKDSNHFCDVIFFYILSVGLVSISMLSNLGRCGLDHGTCAIGHSTSHSVSFAKERLKTKLHHSAGLTAANSSHFHCLDKPEATAHVSCIEWVAGKWGGVALLRGDLD